LADQLRVGMGIISLFVAMFALLLFSLRLNEFIEEGIEWEMIVYYTALFVLMGVLVGVGSLQPINNLLVGLIGDGTKGNLILVALVVGLIGLPIAGFLSGSSAAILFAQIFNKVTASIGIKGLGFWFAFVCAGNMGGSLSPLGSITILLAIKILRREGDDITFMYYIKKTLLLTIIHALMAIGYTFILIAVGV
jgi:Na+/H+ antiporter NhaD/arsenite permease-like protein